MDEGARNLGRIGSFEDRFLNTGGLKPKNYWVTSGKC